jgi:filamentous hemagglutinin
MFIVMLLRVECENHLIVYSIGINKVYGVPRAVRTFAMSAPKSHPRASGGRSYFAMLLSGGLLALTLGTALAGDLLRGGYSSNANQSANPTSFTPPSASQARANMQDSLARASRTIQAVQQMQTAARALAAGAGKNNLGINPNNPSQQLPDVPNGLGAGGLEPAAGAASNSTLWSGAMLPTETTSKGQTVVTVDQDAQEAVLTWSSFNVGSATTLDFNQSKTGANVEDSIVFNIVEGSSTAPSQILGSIQAPGQVYVINQNGIIFGGAAQVNVHTLVASSLPINTNLIGRGLLNNPDDQYLFSQLAIPAGSNGPTPAFNPPAAPLADGEDGNVTVQPGAQITAAANADNTGGRVALIGPNVTNAGTISTPDGQTILAAGDQVGFLASADSTLRGLDTYIGEVDAASGNATNTGTIDVDQGEAMMAGKSVNQLGVIASTTSVTLNGRVDLDAAYDADIVQGLNNTALFAPTASGMVTLGPGSETQILPELASTETVVGAMLALPSEVNIEGETIHFATNSQVLAPDASVNVTAGGWYQASTSPAQLIPDSGQIYFDAGATIDVAGSIVSGPVSENIVSAELLGPELADSPLQRNGPLYGQTIEVDAREAGIYDGVEWEGTPLANVAGYIDLIQRPVGELTTAGGTVNLTAGGSVVMKATSEINVSGGAIDYQGGMVQTTDLISDGQIVNIANAAPDRVYQGILGNYTVDHAAWGIQESFTTPLVGGAVYQDSYVEGGNGGSITISAPAVALDGEMIGQTSPGPRQLVVTPGPASLTLSFQMDSTLNTPVSPTPPHVIFEADASLAAVPAFAVDASGAPIALPADRQAEVILSPGLLTQDGFGSLTVNDGDGDVTVPAGVALNAGPFGSVALSAANLDIEGSITAPDGSLSFTVYDFSPYSTFEGAASPDPARGHFTLGSKASLITAGLIIDNLPFSPTAFTQIEATGGGAITIDSYSADLAAGSTIDVSGGLMGGANGKLTYGTGGALSISVGEDPNANVLITGGRLTLGATLTGYSGGAGGSLSIEAPAIQIGGGAPADADTLVLDPSFFSEGGFASFSLTGFGNSIGNSATNVLPGILIAPNTTIAPIVENWLADSLRDEELTLAPTILPAAQRTPVSLTFSAPGIYNGVSNTLVTRGDFVMGGGAVIITDPLGSVSISGGGKGTATVLGSIIAPGGKISITGGVDSSTIFNGGDGTMALATVFLGSNALLSTAGTTVLTPDAFGYPTGLVLAGGSITISGNIVAAAGSVLNVSGASGVLYLPEAETTAGAQGTGSFLGEPVAPFRVDSNGGSITLSGGQELYTDATLIGASGGPSAVGGSLSVGSGLFFQTGAGANPTTPNLTITQGGLPITTPVGIGQAVPGTNGQGGGRIAVDSFQGGGFDNITLGGNVQFDGAVSVTAGGELSVGTGGFITSGGAVSLAAPYVVLGLPFQGPLTLNQEGESPFTIANITTADLTPTSGPGSLTVTAALIDIGTLSLQNISQANFNAAGGDIRGDGILDVAGHIEMTAGQIYPATDVTFTIAAYDEGGMPGSVTIHASGSRDLPLSAGGTLNVYASIISQDGVLRAPMGTINLGWNGAAGTAPIDPVTGAPVDSTTTLTLGSQSITSVSAVDPLTGQALLIPYGSNPTGTEWIDPAGNNITAGGVPEKAINIAGTQVIDKAGSVIDLSGGGDLSSYEFVSGEGGSTDFLNPGVRWTTGSTYSAGQLVTYKGATWVALQQNSNDAPAVNQYWSEVPASYAVIPGYQASYAPYAPFNSVTGDAGYVSASLQVGEKIYLGAGSGLAPGFYTLLPARYALLPGAYLVTPESGTPVLGQTEPDGSNVVSGYLFNGFSNPRGLTAPLMSLFQADSQSVVLSRGQYETFLADSFLAKGAATDKVAPPLLPIDAGQLNFNAGNQLSLQGVVDAQAPGGGTAGFVDINSSSTIDITSASSGGAAGTLTLSSAELSSFGAANLLIGGFTTTEAGGTTLTVDTSNITVESGATLSGGDIILVANDSLTLDNGATITAAGSSDNEVLNVTGNGVLLRVSNDRSAGIARTGVTSSGAATLTVGGGASGAGVKLKGGSIILDSSQNSTLAPNATLDAKAVTIDSGLISIVEPSSGATPGGLILSGNALGQIESQADALTLLSYSSIDIYGTGQIGTATVLGSLTLSAAEIRGFDQGTGTDTLAARNITIEGNASGTSPAAGQAGDGTLGFSAGVIHLGANTVGINEAVALNATGGIIAQSGAGSVVTQGALTLTAPLITGAAGAQETIAAGGAVTITGAASTVEVTGGLGASLSITAASIQDDGNIYLPSGKIALEAQTGDLVIGDSTVTELSVAGTQQSILDLTKYTSGGTITLESETGFVDVDANATLDVAAQDGGGNGGTITISAPQQSVSLVGALQGKGGAGGANGSFSLDAGSIPSATVGGITYAQGSLDLIDSILDAGQFTQSISIRDRTDADVTLDGSVTANTYDVSADQGSITIGGAINAFDVAATGPFGNAISIGGSINLTAAGSVTLEEGAILNVSAQNFNNAGQGGSVTLSAGAGIVNGANGSTSTNGSVDVEAGSTINLSVADSSNVAAAVEALSKAGQTPAEIAAAIQNTNYGNDFAGTLLIETPETQSGGVQVSPILGTIIGAAGAVTANGTPVAAPDASSIVVEGYQVYNTYSAATSQGTTSRGVINSALESLIYNNGVNFLGAVGTTTSNYMNVMNGLVSSNADLGSQGTVNLATQGLTLNLETGAEIIDVNPTNPSAAGNLTLGSAAPYSASNDWNLAADRFGPNGTAGALTLRASGNLVFDNSLSDGFTSSAFNATLLAQNTALPANIQAWSYTLTAGADMSAADSGQVIAGAGSLELGRNDPNPIVTTGLNATPATALNGFYQVIRTGAGNIAVSTGANVELLNQFATIYTAGAQVQDATMDGEFSVPILDESDNNIAQLGAGKSTSAAGYPVQYSLAGGNITISALQDIEHLTMQNGSLVMDSESELPDNWLYRRGDVASGGLFDSNSKIRGRAGGDPSESTSWWIDFSNFFEGVGALGGGNVTMTAGGDVANVDAVVPTNARMPGVNTATGVNLAPNAGSIVELGGGNLLVQAGNDINAGVYYVENGQGALTAGNQILTNSTRTPVGGEGLALGNILAPVQSELPTTLFAGDASFDVTAEGNILLGPVANPFLLPEGLENSIWYKTYFSTYGLNDTVDVTSLGGSITFREDAQTSAGSGPILQVWLQNMDLFYNVTDTRAFYQPWLRLNETSVFPFSTAAELMPATLVATAFSGNINIVGDILLSPSPTGTISLAAAGSINGFQSLGTSEGTTTWIAAAIDISDSSPASIPGSASPLGYQEVPGIGTVVGEADNTNTDSNFLGVLANLFTATNIGTPGVIETEQELHDPAVLHAGDSTPVELYAASGDISDLALYSPTETRVIAGGDISDIALYLQNDAANSVSVVSAGGDITAYDPSSSAREAAQGADTLFQDNAYPGDIQIAGPGTLEVLAGGDLELGGQGPGGPTNTTGDGIASMGNTLNPALPFAGADIIAAAGIGGSLGLSDSELDFPAFISQFIESPVGTGYLGELSQVTPSAPAGLDAASYSKLPASEQDLLALDVFFLALRDAGRDHNNPASAGSGNYNAGLAAIAALFPRAKHEGDIDVTSRDIVTESRGNISLLAPSGQVTVGLNSSGGGDVTNLGIVTQDGGNISIFSSGDVNVGTSRIFTLRGGNEIIWSSNGNIDSGASSKTVQSAPPTRVLVDPQSANVKTDLAGLATGGGIGVLASVADVAAGNVDLIAPTGVVNAGEAGIRATGNLNIAAVQVLNAGNISVGGASSGLPPPVAGPNIAGLAAASSAAGSSIGSATSMPTPQNNSPANDSASIITVQVVGYGGGDDSGDSDTTQPL